MTTAYHWHRRVLQTLQRHVPTERWVLKWPGHANHLPTLLATYPDARIVVCHRDPLAMLSSVSSLTATLRWAHSNEVDLHHVAAEQADTFAAQCDRLTRWDRLRSIEPGRIVHVRFDEFMVDQVEAVRRVHAHFQEPLAPVAVERIEAHLAAKPRGRLGGHEHSFDDLGLDAGMQRERFGEYQRHFGITSETDGG
jgi:Sulfotransferase family